MSLAASPILERKRVKVYELRESDWFDRGTGFCAVEAINDDGRIFVESEDSPDNALLDIKIKKDDNYQKQQDTLIVWTDPGGVDMALSFQEADGCSAVWLTLREAQESLGGFLHPILDLPKPSLGVLEKIESIVKTGATAQHARDVLVKSAATDNYVAKLAPLVEEAEDLESLDDLHRLCNIMKQLILFNDNQIIEQIVQEDVFDGTIGALEYDPDFPNHKANHRQFFKDNAKFKEVVEISDAEVRKKIHYTYRLQYLKDVALARILDDPSFTLFNSLIYFHHIDIVTFVAQNQTFLHDIFGIINSKDRPLQERKDAIAFVQQSCQIAKTLQAGIRAQLYNRLLNSGLFQAVSFALQSKDSAIRIAGTDVLVSIIDHDMLMMRTSVHRAANETMTPITDTLIDLFLVETDLGVKAQVADAIKVLLDSNPIGPPMGDSPLNENGIAAKFRNGSMNQANRVFLDKHLQPSMQKLFEPLNGLVKQGSLRDFSTHEVSLLSHLVEILSFFIRQPSQQAKRFILSEGLIPKTVELTHCSDKHLRLCAIKLIKICALAPDQDNAYYRSITTNNTLARLIDLAKQPKDNLMNSAVLDFFRQIKFWYRKERLYKGLLQYLGDNYHETLSAISYTPIFDDILGDYDRMMDPNQPSQIRTEGDMDASFMTSDAGSPHGIITGGSSRWSSGLHEDADEDAYFSAQDADDEDQLSRDADSLPNGVNASPLSKPLVDYGDDEEDDGSGKEDSISETPPNARNRFRDAMDEDTSSSPTPAHNLSSPEKELLSSDSSAPTSTLPPPTSVAEKRRREEDDDEDELGKLMVPGAKRRNSASKGGTTLRGASPIDAARSETPDAWVMVDGENQANGEAEKGDEPESDSKSDQGISEDQQDQDNQQDSDQPPEKAKGKESPNEKDLPKIQMLRRRPRQTFSNSSSPGSGSKPNGTPKMAFKLGSAAGGGEGKK